MEVTEVRVFPVNEEKLKAYVTITFDDCFVVRDLKIINGNNGLFVAMPSKKRKDGKEEKRKRELVVEGLDKIENVEKGDYKSFMDWITDLANAHTVLQVPSTLSRIY